MVGIVQVIIITTIGTLKKVVDQLTNGFFAQSGAEFEAIYDSLVIQKR